MHHPLSFKKQLTSYQMCFMRTNPQDPIYTVCNITYMEEQDRSVD